MTKYTAADFANARFAEHPSGSKAMRSGYPLPPWLIDSSGAPFVWQEDQEMADEGWVPVPTKPTLTDSQLEEACGQWYESDDFLMGFMAGYEKAGGAIIDDPAPTEAEKIEQLLWKINSEYSSVTMHGAEAVKGWAHQLAKHGVRVEEGK